VAAEVSIDGEQYKQRSPTAAWLLTLVTLLVYWLVWYYKFNDEARRCFPGARRLRPSATG
jgi:hypothetical protein